MINTSSISSVCCTVHRCFRIADEASGLLLNTYYLPLSAFVFHVIVRWIS